MSQRQQHKDKTRGRIVGSAVRRLKTEGLTGASVADIMSDAGLTVGGFYAHFASKEALADEAVRKAVGDRRRMFLEHFDGVEWCERTCSAIDQYFAKDHRDNPANGCPLSISAMEAVRTRSITPAFVEEFERFAKAMQNGTRADLGPAPREAVLGTLALMVGGMILARAAGGYPISDEILQAARSFGVAAVRGLAKPPAKKRSTKVKKLRGGSK